MSGRHLAVRPRSWGRWSMLLVVVAMVAGGTAALAADPSTATEFTGCLSPGGNLGKVAEGPAPIDTCKRNETQITWSATGPPGVDGAPGAEGPPGPAGVDGADGADGAPGGLNGYERVVSIVEADGFGSHYAICPAGKVALGGGYNSASADPVVLASYPTDAGGLVDRWLVEGALVSDSAIFVLCALPAAP